MREYNINDYNIRNLGSFYHLDKTVFRVFGPNHEQLYLVINNHDYLMHRNGMNFEIALGGNLEGVKYHYKNEKGICFRDPFSFVSIGDDSIVLDSEKFNKERIKLPKCDDRIIYEVSVNDFSVDDSYKGKYKAKFLGLSEEGLTNSNLSIGLDYLKGLGVTHIQLMPIFDYDLDGAEYNWGYNPLAYNYVKKDYVFDDTNPYAYINELRESVNELHRNGLRVVLDVVFNHMYDRVATDLDKMLPGRLYRYLDDGSKASGTMCGNEINSEDPFIEDYIVFMVLRYLRLFDIDGIRMDLMGILDYETVNLIYDTLKSYKPDFVVYGEGWNMGDKLPVEKRAAIINADKMPEIGMFNDCFRDVIIKYVCGDDSINEDVKKVLMADENYLNYKQSINYVECHDGYTFFDRLNVYMSDDPDWVKTRRCKLALGLVLLSRGIPFIHSGEEFLRTKENHENSYNLDNSINKLDWDLRVKNDNVVKYCKELIEFRKNHPCFVKKDAEILFSEAENTLIYQIEDLAVVINHGSRDVILSDRNSYHVVFNNNGKCDYNNEYISIPAYSLLICRL